MSAGSVPVDLDERIDSVGVVLAPRGWRPTVRSSEILAATDQSIRRVSRLRVRSPDQAGIDSGAFQQCAHERRFSCWLRLVLPTAGRVRRPFAFVIIVHPREGVAAVTVVGIDSQPYFELRDVASDEQIEAALRTRALTVGPIMVDGAAWATNFRARLRDSFEPFLTARGQGLDHGAIDVSASCSKCEVRVDGRPVGVISEPGLVLRGLRPGKRAVSLFRGGEQFEMRRVNVVPQSRTPLVFERRIENADPLGPTLLWGGAAALAAGATTFGIGLGLERSQPVLVCLMPSCSTPLMARGWSATSAAFLAAGATWMTTWLLRSDDDEASAWWGIGLGIAAGLGAGLAAASL
ncbi:MAG: hypothetical protein AAF449_10430 [Myxococcota bacterium]